MKIFGRNEQFVNIRKIAENVHEVVFFTDGYSCLFNVKDLDEEKIRNMNSFPEIIYYLFSLKKA